MKIYEVINAINNLNEFIKKKYEIPFVLRRAIKKNYSVLLEEYKIYDEQRKEIVAKEDEQSATEELKTLLNTDIDVEVVKVNVDVLADIKMPYTDELLIEFMLNEEE